MLILAAYTFTDVLVVFGSSILLSVLLAELFDWTHVFSDFERTLCSYGYEECNGPHTWKEQFPDSLGDKQSPINIDGCSAIVVPDEELHWSIEYNSTPSALTLYNDGHTATIYTRWFTDARPAIKGGPLDGEYELYSLRFRWGPSDDEGSEHTVNLMRYALELQAMHTKTGIEFCDLLSDGMTNAIVMVVYLFKVTSVDNPYLEQIISGLKLVRNAGSRINLNPFPISWLMPPFSSNYYTYTGSLTHPPCTEGVQWIVQPEPLAISSKQVQKFRKLMTENGYPLVCNSRPVQNVNGREILYYE